jgi:hypothetical protein
MNTVLYSTQGIQKPNSLSLTGGYMYLTLAQCCRTGPPVRDYEFGYQQGVMYVMDGPCRLP